MRPENATIREALAAHELFRKLGFPPDDIFLAPGPENLVVLLRSQGLEFALEIGKHGLSEKETSALWTAAATWWNESGDDAERDALWAKSQARAQGAAVLFALLAKGFRIAPERTRRAFDERVN